MTSTGKPGTPAAASGLLEETGVDVMVAYGRTLATTATTVAGLSVAVDVSVAGPGGTTKLYLGGQGSTPIGLSGGSRDVQSGNPVTLKDINSTWEAFVADPGLAIVTIPVAYDALVRHAISDTFAYYEQPLNVSQRELIPAWVYNVDFMLAGEVVLANALVYVPASPLYYPPDVVIDSPLAGATIVTGRAVALNATVSGGNGPFTYEWSSSSQGVLGTTEDITTALVATARPDQAPAPVAVALKVTDANGLSRTAVVSVNVVGQTLWLPVIVSNR